MHNIIISTVSLLLTLTGLRGAVISQFYSQSPAKNEFRLISTEEYNLQINDWAFVNQHGVGRGISIYGSVPFGAPYHLFIMELIAPAGQTIVPGIYTDLERVNPRPGDNRFEFYFDNQPYGDWTGSANVIEISFNAEGGLNKLVMDMNLFSKENLNVRITSSTRINSDIAFTSVPEPGALVITISSFLFISGRRRR